jgi:hypothetical protein
VLRKNSFRRSTLGGDDNTMSTIHNIAKFATGGVTGTQSCTTRLVPLCSAFYELECDGSDQESFGQQSDARRSCRSNLIPPTPSHST